MPVFQKTGNIYAAFLFSYLLHIENMESVEDRWIPKTFEDLKQETGLSRHLIKKAVRILQEHDFLETKEAASPCHAHVVTHYRVKWV